MVAITRTQRNISMVVYDGSHITQEATNGTSMASNSRIREVDADSTKRATESTV